MARRKINRPLPNARVIREGYRRDAEEAIFETPEGQKAQQSGKAALDAFQEYLNRARAVLGAGPSDQTIEQQIGTYEQWLGDDRAPLTTPFYVVLSA